MYLAIAGESVCLYKTDNYKLHQVYKPPTNGNIGEIRDLSWSYDGRCFGIVVDGLPFVELLRVKEDVSLYKTLHVVDPLSIAFAKHGNGFVGIGSKNGVVHAMNYLNKNESKSLGSCCTKVTSVDFSITDSSIAAGTSDGKIHIFRMESRMKTGLFELRTNQLVSSVKFHPLKRGILAVGCHDGSVTIWDVNFGHVEGQYLCHGASCAGVVFSPNNTTFLASVGYDGSMFCFDIRSKKTILKAAIPDVGSSLDIHKDGRTMAVGTACGSVYVFDLRNLSVPLTHFVTSSIYVNKVAYQPPTSGGRKSLPPRQPSLTERLFGKMDSPSLLERTGSFASSSKDVFSPLARIGEIPSPLSPDVNTFSPVNSISYQVASDSSLAKLTTESVIRETKCTPVDENENLFDIQPCETNMSRTQELLDLSLLGVRKEDGEEEFFNDLPKNSSLPSFLQPVDSAINVTQESVIRETKCTPVDENENLFDIQPCETNMSRTQELLDLSLLGVRKEDGEEEFFNDLPKNSSLPSFLQPVDSAINVTQGNNFGSYLNKSLSKLDVASVQHGIDTKHLTPDELKFDDNVMEACGALESDLGNKACINPKMSMENLSSVKEYIDEKFNDVCVDLKKQMLVMHTFNISSHEKQEMMLSKIYSQLNKSTSDKSLGTD